jgi:hypothetical protein
MVMLLSQTKLMWLRRFFILPLLAFYTAVLFDLYEHYKKMLAAPIALWNPSFYLISAFCLGIFSITITGLWKPEWFLPLSRIRSRLNCFRWAVVIAAGLITSWFFFFTAWSEIFSGNYARVFIYLVTIVFMAWMSVGHNSKHFQVSSALVSAILFIIILTLGMRAPGWISSKMISQTALAQTHTAESKPAQPNTSPPIPGVAITTNDLGPTPSIPQILDYEWVHVTIQAAYAQRDGAGALVHNDRMWLIGGWNIYDKDSFPMLTNNEVWSSQNGYDWRLEKPNSFLDSNFDSTSDWEGRHSAGYVVYKGKMWIIGGDAIQGHYQSDVWNSEDGINWTRVNAGQPVPWGPRVLHYTVVFQDKIWVIGGQTIPQFSQANETFYSDIWTTTDGINWEHIIPEQPSWSARGTIGGSAVYNGRIWILGGAVYQTTTIAERKMYNDVWSSADGVNWIRHTKSAPWQPRAYHSVAVYDGYMWVVGGHNRGNLKDVWFSSNGVDWTEFPNTPWRAYHHAASIFVYDNSLWIVAGSGPGKNVWSLSPVDDN